MKQKLSSLAIPGITLAVIVAFLALPPGSSQPPTRILPTFSISPATLPTGETSSVLACVHNGSAASNRTLDTGDSFGFTFGPACTVGLAVDAGAVVNSNAFADVNFGVGFDAANEVAITYNGTPVVFPPGDSFCAIVTFDGPANNSACTVASAAPNTNNYNPPAPDFNLISVVDFGPGGGVPADTIVLSSTGVCPAGFAAFPTFDGRFLVAGAIAGALGGADTHTHDAGTYAAGAHTHTVEGSGSPNDVRFVDDNSGGDDHLVSGQNHTHSLSAAEAAGGAVAGVFDLGDNRPAFATITLCRAT